EGSARVAERGHADAAPGRRHQGPAEPGLHRGEADRLTPSAVPPRSRRHAEAVRGILVGARAGAEPGGVDRAGNAVAGLQPGGKAAEAMRLAPFARRRAGDLLEDAVEM